MRICTIKTHKVTAKDRDLYVILDRHLTSFAERSILAITSKIISICQRRVVKVGDAEQAPIDKQALVEKEADYFLPASASKYRVHLTIKGNLLIPEAGVDESNGNGYYILWPLDLQKTANQVRAYLRKRFSREWVGVIITDSKTTPLR